MPGMGGCQQQQTPAAEARETQPERRRRLANAARAVRRYPHVIHRAMSCPGNFGPIVDEYLVKWLALLRLSASFVDPTLQTGHGVVQYTGIAAGGIRRCDSISLPIVTFASPLLAKRRT